MKLSEWAGKHNMSYITAYRWFKSGKLPVKASQDPTTGTIILDEEETCKINIKNEEEFSEETCDFIDKILRFSLDEKSAKQAVTNENIMNAGKKLFEELKKEYSFCFNPIIINFQNTQITEEDLDKQVTKTVNKFMSSIKGIKFPQNTSATRPKILYSRNLDECNIDEDMIENELEKK